MYMAKHFWIGTCRHSSSLFVRSELTFKSCDRKSSLILFAYDFVGFAYIPLFVHSWVGTGNFSIISVMNFVGLMISLSVSIAV